MRKKSLNKITREFFSDHPPLYEENMSEQKNIINSLKEKIKEKNNLNLKIENNYTSYFGRKEIDKERNLRIEIPNPYRSGSWYDRARLVISFEKEMGKDKLCIKPEYEKQFYNFSGKIEDLLEFYNLVMEKYRDLDNKKTKTEKIKKLKKGAVLARIKELAKKKKFNFYLEELNNKLQLSIQIGERGIITIDILFSKFQQEMGKIENIVDSSRELEKSGIVANVNFRSLNNEYQLRHFTKYTDP